MLGSPSMTEYDSDADSSDGVECPTCGKQCASRSGLGIHHSTAHGESINEYEQRVDDEYSHECPSCEQCFETAKGVRLHHAKTHGESIAGDTVECHNCGGSTTAHPYKIESQDKHFCDMGCFREWEKTRTAEVVCEQCGESFEIYTNREDEARFCSRECHGRFRAENGLLEGEKHPMWNGGPASLQCEWCSVKFEITPGNAEGRRFCSAECYAEWCSETKTGEDAPRWDGGLVESSCEQCDGVFETRPSAEARFCSRECFGKWRAESGTFSGPNHPNWKGGPRIYGEGWDEKKRESIRESQNRKCAGCGVDESELRRRLDVHHIVPAREFDDPEKRNDESNLVAMCRNCHKSRWEGIPLRPQIVQSD